MDDTAVGCLILARALSAQGKMADAESAIAKASELTQKGGDTNVRLRVAIESALLRANSGVPADISEAKRSIQATLDDASMRNLTAIQLEARLGMGKLELKSGDRANGRAHLAALQKDATAKGFLLIARKSIAARQ